jgi:hypothetical protein
MSKRRYSGNDSHFGPFTLSRHNDGDWRPLGIMLDSGGDHESSGNKGCNLKLHGFGRTLIIELPRLLPDFRIRHIAESWDAATVARMGRNWYDEVFPREYGFTVSDGTLHAHYGPQTHDSSTTKSKCFFLPWCNWRFVRQSWYGPTGEHIETLWETTSRDVRSAQWAWRHEFESALVKTCFEFFDYDGELNQAATHIEEHEWRFGTGLFAWLSLFRKHKIRRSLDIAFNKEVGPEKGSWKGGTMGTSISMLPGELHEAAFRRYCEQEHLSKYRPFRVTFVKTGPASKAARTQSEDKAG